MVTYGDVYPGTGRPDLGPERVAGDYEASATCWDNRFRQSDGIRAEEWNAALPCFISGCLSSGLGGAECDMRVPRTWLCVGYGSQV